MTYCGFPGHTREHVLIRISKLKSEQYCWGSRENRIRNHCLVKHLDGFSSNPLFPLYQRPIPLLFWGHTFFPLLATSQESVSPLNISTWTLSQDYIRYAVITNDPQFSVVKYHQNVFSHLGQVKPGLWETASPYLSAMFNCIWNMCTCGSLPVLFAGAETHEFCLLCTAHS
jgi:hypothetical protein